MDTVTLARAPEPDLENATMADIEDEKQSLLASARDQQLASGVTLPASLEKCFASLRHTCVCKTIVAHNPKTKLNELHLMQPGLLLLVACGVALLPATGIVLSNVYVPSGLEVLGVAALCTATSALLCVVGFIARSIPSQGDLNVQLDAQNKALGGNVDAVERSSGKAESLQKKMSLSWVSARRQTRDATHALQATYMTEVQRDARFQFKVKLLEYLVCGETNRAWRQQRDLEGEFENNYEEMAKQYANPLAELKRQKSTFAPNGKLSAEELREVVKEVEQTETAAEGAYQFLGALIKTVIEKDYDQHLATINAKEAAKGGALSTELSYSELVHLLLERADQPPFREQYLQAFCLDIAPPSPPPSPPTAPTVAKAVGAFIWLETYKAVLLRKVWILGVLCVVASVGLLTVTAAPLAMASPVTAVQARLTFAIASIAQLAAAVVGWWTCQNKKDDLNMMRSLSVMGKHVRRLEKAEGRLRGALDAMAVSGAEMDSLDAEIEEAFTGAQAQLEKVKVVQERRREGIKAHTLTNVLMKFVNMDDRPYWYDQQELKKLHSMICAMTGEPCKPLEHERHDDLRRELLKEVLVPGEKYLADAVHPLLTDQLPGNQVLDILLHNKAFELIMDLPLDDSDSELAKDEVGTAPHGHV